ncbi:hypothetical protein IGB42_02544 [Andreprevotia sp. IGB-42]|uniref:hypothetical protein n=1 Tax=Andreprevotia sp. IGB-42 TaxID=2497473 RepID=UPI00135A4329|nr:hypothetical protein [Andreprevotia sp. IGB-42]KAF0813143.1 hypothetical protein IGB42_02544 [Andreprevotia sp. IGB-42]
MRVQIEYIYDGRVVKLETDIEDDRTRPEQSLRLVAHAFAQLRPAQPVPHGQTARQLAQTLGFTQFVYRTINGRISETTTVLEAKPMTTANRPPRLATSGYGASRA